MKKLIALLLAALILFTGCNSNIPNEWSNTGDNDNVINNTQNDNQSNNKQDTTLNGLPDEGPIIAEDPYVNVNKTDFYKNYTPAVSASDAKFRSQHYLMSGSIAEQDQEPSIAQNRPIENGKYLRNTSCLYSEDKNTYFILDSEGKIVHRIFRGGAYVTLEEVAAYLLAFGEVPVNYTSNKSGSPSKSPWGKYLRCNNSKFSGDTIRYPYEPVLPRISGCGGDLYYYEIDIGTTGTDCDPDYTAAPYNNGSRIVRGENCLHAL